MQEQPEQPLEPNVLIVDRIYAGPPGTGCDMWYHHAAAMQAAASWKDPLDDDSNNNDNNDNNNNNDTETATRPVSTPYDCHGGHLLPRQPLFQKGDKVQVYYDEAWWWLFCWWWLFYLFLHRRIVLIVRMMVMVMLQGANDAP